jgi:hypothetical protein
MYLYEEKNHVALNILSKSGVSKYLVFTLKDQVILQVENLVLNKLADQGFHGMTPVELTKVYFDIVTDSKIYKNLPVKI